jgi:hypothetical protein
MGSQQSQPSRSRAMGPLPEWAETRAAGSGTRPTCRVLGPGRGRFRPRGAETRATDAFPSDPFVRANAARVCPAEDSRDPIASPRKAVLLASEVLAQVWPM